MRRFKKILFVNEPGNLATSAPQRAVELARANNAQLTLCDASQELPRTMSNLQTAYKEIHLRQVESLFEKIDLTGIDIKTSALTGIPFVEIIMEVQREGYDLVIKSAEGGGGVLDNLFGATDMHLMRKCPCPVWIVKQSTPDKHARIFAAVDPDPEVPANAELNKLILELAASLAHQENSELHIAHAWYLQGEQMFRSVRSLLTEQEIDELLVSTEKSHKKRLDQLLKQHDLEGIVSRVHLVKGDPGKVIPYLVSENKADLVVMGTVARTGIEGFIIGNTAEKILRAVDCSVLTVKPESFNSPVKG